MCSDPSSPSQKDLAQRAAVRAVRPASAIVGIGERQGVRQVRAGCGCLAVLMNPNLRPSELLRFTQNLSPVKARSGLVCDVVCDGLRLTGAGIECVCVWGGCTSCVCVA